MACPTRAGTAPYVRFITDVTGETVNQDIWHDLKGESKVTQDARPAPLDDALAAAQALALAFDRDGWTSEAYREMESRIRGAYRDGQATPRSTVNLVNWLAKGNPASKIEKARGRLKAKREARRADKAAAKKAEAVQAEKERKAKLAYDTDIMFGRIVDPERLATEDGWRQYEEALQAANARGDVAAAGVIGGAMQAHLNKVYETAVDRALNGKDIMDYGAQVAAAETAFEARQRGDMKTHGDIIRRLAAVLRIEEERGASEMRVIKSFYRSAK